MRSLFLLGGLAVAAGLVAPACYNPKIDEGAFFCGDGGVCPEGFGCDHGRCYKSAMAECALCTPPAAAAATGTCDPVCQTGCTCNQQCVPVAPKPTCVPITTALKEVHAACNGNEACKPGSLCIPDRGDNAACGSHCFRLCYNHAQCGPGSRCLDGVGISGTNLSYGLCSSEIEDCSPLGPNAGCLAANRPSPAFACYVLSIDEPERTVCECAGTASEGQACKSMHDCRPGLECISKGTESICRQLCTPEGLGLPVSLACRNPMLRCRRFDIGKPRFGYCI